MYWGFVMGYGKTGRPFYKVTCWGLAEIFYWGKRSVTREMFDMHDVCNVCLFFMMHDVMYDMQLYELWYLQGWDSFWYGDKLRLSSIWYLGPELVTKERTLCYHDCWKFQLDPVGEKKDGSDRQLLRCQITHASESTIDSNFFRRILKTLYLS